MAPHPTTGSTQYSSPISITVTTTLKFFAKDTAGNQEAVKTQVYTIGACEPPQVTVHPVSQSACPGSSVNFGVTATGTAPLSYSGGRRIESGALARALLQYPNGDHDGFQHRRTDAANYDCVVTGQCNPTATSNAAA